MFIVPALVLSQATAETVLQRHARFMERWNTISVDVRSRTTVATGEGKGRVVLSKPNLVSFQMNWGVHQYNFSQSDRRVVEFERSNRKYRDFMTFPVWVSPPGVVSGVPDYGFPNMLLQKDFRKMPGLSDFKLIRATPGTRAQTIGATLRAMGGPIEYEFKIDELGRPIQIRSTAQGQRGKIVTDHFLTNWIADRTYPLAMFSGAVPNGFVSGALPQEPFPIAPGERFPVGDWVELSNRRVVSGLPTSGRGRFLVAIVQPECAPSRQLMSFLRKTKSEFRLPVSTIWHRVPSGLSDAAAYSSRTSSPIQRLRLAGTPALFLIDTNGIVEQLWVGFHPSMEATIKKDVMTTLKP